MLETITTSDQGNKKLKTYSEQKKIPKKLLANFRIIFIHLPVSYSPKNFDFNNIQVFPLQSSKVKKNIVAATERKTNSTKPQKFTLRFENLLGAWLPDPAFFLALNQRPTTLKKKHPV